MHKGAKRIREEDLDDSHSHSFKNRNRDIGERDDAVQHKSAARKSKWVFGNLFECLSGNENCSHGRIPFGGSFYCALPLKETSTDLHLIPPCV